MIFQNDNPQADQMSFHAKPAKGLAPVLRAKAAEGRRTPKRFARTETAPLRASVWSAVASAPLSSGRRFPLVRERVARTRAAVNTPDSKRFAKLNPCDGRVECLDGGCFNLRHTRGLRIKYATVLAIPKGLWLKAQGWRVCEPTLGRRPTHSSTATRLWPGCPQPADRLQPRALGRNPFGIREGTRAGRILMD